MKEFNLYLEKGKRGFLTDGRSYEIISIPGIFISTSGTLKYGDIELFIDEERYTIRLSEFMECVATMGNMSVRDVHHPKFSSNDIWSKYLNQFSQEEAEG